MIMAPNIRWIPPKSGWYRVVWTWHKANYSLELLGGTWTSTCLTVKYDQFIWCHNINSIATSKHSLLLRVETREPVWLNSANGRREQKRQKKHCYTPQACHCLYPNPLVSRKQDGWLRLWPTLLAFHSGPPDLSLQQCDAHNLSINSWPMSLRGQVLYQSTRVLFMFNQICNMGINVRFMANLGYDKSFKLCKYMCFEI